MTKRTSQPARDAPELASHCGQLPERYTIRLLGSCFEAECEVAHTTHKFKSSGPAGPRTRNSETDAYRFSLRGREGRGHLLPLPDLLAFWKITEAGARSQSCGCAHQSGWLVMGFFNRHPMHIKSRSVKSPWKPVSRACEGGITHPNPNAPCGFNCILM